jgi:hypothetical protein
MAKSESKSESKSQERDDRTPAQKVADEQSAKALDSDGSQSGKTGK